MARLLNKVAKISAFQAGDPGNQKTYFDSEIRVPAGAFNLKNQLILNDIFLILNHLLHTFLNF